MKRLRALLLASLCCLVCGAVLAGCGNNDVKQDPGKGGKGLTPDERKDKQPG